MDYLIGKVIDGYRIDEVLGKGGMGIVYKAKDTTLDRDVALKIMDSNLARDENFLKRFQAEAKALAKLQNAHIVSIFSLRETQVGLFIVMEFVDGGTLSDRLKENGPMQPGEAVAVFRQILAAMGYAHEAGIVHRDIKPGNIMLTRNGVVKITDFGLAKVQQQASAVTMTIGTGGTLFYMSPEQVRGLANVDARGDIYSLGMTLYEAVTGRTPFSDSESDFDIRQSIVEGKIPPPDKFNPALPKPLVKVIQKAIDKSLDKRYQTAAEMLQALEAVPLDPSGAPTRPSVQQSSSKLKPALVAGAGLVALAAAYFAFLSPGKETVLSIATIPAEGRVILNGEPVGVSPINAYKLSSGKVTVHVEREGYLPRDTVLNLAEGANISIILSLSPLERQTAADTVQQTTAPQTEAPVTEQRPQQNTPPVERPRRNDATERSQEMGTAVLAAVPRGAVTINGETIEVSEDNPVMKKLPPGDYPVMFRNPRFGSKAGTISISAGQTRKLTCYFEQYLNIGANPVWGTIVVNGNNTGEYTPKDRYPVKPGIYRITVRREGYETVEGERTIVVEPSFTEKVHTLVFTLKK